MCNIWILTQNLATTGTQECIWNLSYNERRMAIELELTQYLDAQASL